MLAEENPNLNEKECYVVKSKDIVGALEEMYKMYKEEACNGEYWIGKASGLLLAIEILQDKEG